MLFWNNLEQLYFLLMCRVKDICKKNCKKLAHAALF